MRVLMLTQFYPPVIGGQERHVRDLAYALAGRGHSVEVATIAAGAAPGTVHDGPVAVHRLHTTAQRVPALFSDRERPHAPPIPDPGLRAGLRRLLQSGRFDVVHAHDWAVNSLLGPAEHAGTPVVLTQHDYSHVCATKRLVRGDELCPGPRLGRCVRCAGAKHGPVVGPAVVVANFVGRRRREHSVGAFAPVSNAVACGAGPASRVPCEVIPNFVPDELLVDESSLVPPAPDAPLLFAGDLSLDKGIAILLEAYALLDPRPPLLVAGRILGETPGSAPPGATFLGPLPAEQVRDLMRTALAVVVPSLWADPCPTVVLEAMAAGRAVVGSDIGGISELVVHGETGLLAAAGDVGSLAGALHTVASSPDMAATFGRAGLLRVRAYTASVVAERVEALYRRVSGTAP